MLADDILSLPGVEGLMHTAGKTYYVSLLRRLLQEEAPTNDPGLDVDAGGALARPPLSHDIVNGITRLSGW